jgi:choline dehydrogenase-like flavoprotein
MKRPNLQVVTKALVRGILFDGKPAAAVEFERAAQGCISSSAPRPTAR